VRFGSVQKYDKCVAANSACGPTFAFPSQVLKVKLSPQATLQLRALPSIVATSFRVLEATLTDDVKVSAMIKPNMISDQRSTGSRTRLDCDSAVAESVAVP